MKRAVIGGFLSLLGTVWGLAVLVGASANLVSSWSTPPGRLLTTVSQMGLMPVLVISLIFVGLGVGIMAYEFFHKDKAE